MFPLPFVGDRLASPLPRAAIDVPIEDLDLPPRAAAAAFFCWAIVLGDCRLGLVVSLSLGDLLGLWILLATILIYTAHDHVG